MEDSQTGMGRAVLDMAGGTSPGVVHAVAVHEDVACSVDVAASSVLAQTVSQLGCGTRTGLAVVRRNP